MATKKTPSRLTLEEAAEYLGMSSEDLMHSRFRGLTPGSLGFKVGGTLYFNKGDLPKPAKPKAAEAEPEE